GRKPPPTAPGGQSWEEYCKVPGNCDHATVLWRDWALLDPPIPNGLEHAFADADSLYQIWSLRFLVKGLFEFEAEQAAAKGARRIVEANKLNHIFGKAEHNLGPLVERLGSQEAVFTAVQDATQAAVKSGDLTGVFETTVSVAGQNVVVRGNV